MKKAATEKEKFQSDEKNFYKKSWAWYKWHRQQVKAWRKRPQTFQEKLWSWTKTIVGAIIVVMIINGLLVASFVVPTGSMESTVMTGDFLFVNKFVYGPSSPQVIPFINVPLPFFRLPGIKEPERNDVIVFIFPGEVYEVKAKEFQYYLKRCVAVAGDTLEVRENRLFVNGVESEFPKYGRVKYPGPDTIRPTFFPIGKLDTNGHPWFTNRYGPLRIPKKGDTVQLNMKNFEEWNIFIQREGHKVNKDMNTIYIDKKPATSYVVERNYCFGMGDNRDNSHDSRMWGFIPYENVVGTPLIVYWSWNTNLPFSQFFTKIASIRWDRIFNVIN